MRRGYEIIHCWFIHLIFLKLFSLTLSNYRSSDIFRNLYELLYEDIVIFYTKYWAKHFVQYLIFSTERYRYFHLRFSFFCQQLIYIIIFLSTISETKISDIHFLKLLTLWLLLDRTLKKYFFLTIKIFFLFRTWRAAWWTRWRGSSPAWRRRRKCLTWRPRRENIRNMR